MQWNEQADFSPFAPPAIRPTAGAPVILLLLACAEPPATGGLRQGAADDSTTPEALAEGCHADPLPSDTPRQGLVAFPYAPDEDWGAFALSAEAFTAEDRGLALGRGYSGHGAFTPDGTVGLVADDSGSLSSLWVEGDTISLVSTGWDGGLYAQGVAMHPSGEWAVVADPDWPDSGGGLYRVEIDCESGALLGATRFASGKNPGPPARLPSDPDVFVLSAREVDGTPDGTTVHLVDATTGELLSSADAFGDTDTIVGDVAFSFDGRALFVTDINEFSGNPTRIAILAVEDLSLTPVEVLEVPDPIALLAWPWEGAGMLVLDGYGNKLWKIWPDGDSWTASSALTGLQLPGAVVGITRGSGRGRALVSEVGGLRLVILDEQGGVSDGGIVLDAPDTESMPGAMALQGNL